MKKKKLTLFAVIAAAGLAIIAAVWMLIPHPPSGMSPEETVRYYYSQWGRHSNAGMNAVVYAPVRYPEGFSGMISLELLTCEEVHDMAVVQEGFESEWYNDTPYQVALVHTTFDVQYRDDAMTGLSNGVNYCDYYLVKKSAGSNWIIVSWGQG